MKKLIFSLFILGLSFMGFSQDTVLVDENFNSFPPTDWTTINDAGGSGTTENWSASGYPEVWSDVVAQEEWLISPTISLNSANTYRISFNYYQNYTTFGTTDLQLLVSYDDGTTWDPLDANAEEVWLQSTDGATTNDSWLSATNFPVTAPGVTGGAKFAFVFTSDGADMLNMAIDNIVLEEDPGGGFADYRVYRFESGIASASWTIQPDQGGNGATQTWQDYSFAKVGEDPGLVQEEWLLTPNIAVPDVALSDLILTYSYFSLLNTGSQGVTVYVANEGDWSTYTQVDNTHWAGATAGSAVEQQITLNEITHGYTHGDSLQFAIVFQTTVAGGVDFFLEDFRFEAEFLEGSVAADADITVAGSDSMMYPLFDMYNGNFKEGFWKVQPEGWAVDTTYDGSIRQDAGYLSHDYFALIDTTGSDGGALNETITSSPIEINIPDVGASYLLSFEWYNDADLHAGQNTDPNIPNVYYDFADIIVEISTDGSTWTQIWAEDDEAILDETTVTTNNAPYTTGWTDFDTYLADGKANWYLTEVDISQYITASGNLWVRWNYTGDGENAGEFGLDNFYVMQTSNPQFKLEGVVPFSATADYHIDYVKIPVSQFPDTVIDLGARILNYGNTNFADENLNITVNTWDGGSWSGVQTYGYEVIQNTDFTTYPSTEYFEPTNLSIPQFENGLRIYEGYIYSLGFSFALADDPDNITAQTFTVSSTSFEKHSSTFTDYTVAADGVTGGMGSIFEFKQTDVIDEVKVKLGDVTQGSEVYMTVLQLTDPNATTGTVVYTSPRLAMTNADDFGMFSFATDFTLDAGFYAFMFNQTDNNPLNIAVDDANQYSYVLRGNKDNLYMYDDEMGDIIMTIDVVPNADPVIETTFPNDHVRVIAGNAVDLTLEATDENEDAVEWSYNATPAWLADWMTVTDNGDNTVTITGTPQPEHLGIIDVDMQAWDGKNGTDNYAFELEVVSEIAAFDPDFDDYFDGNNGDKPLGWTVLDDQMETGSDFHWRTLSNDAHIYGDIDEDQDEWLISPPINLPSAKAVGTNYTVEFEWEVYNFNYFAGGIEGVLGTTDADGNHNYADVTLHVSTDFGVTWSEPIWKEDDPELVAPVTEGILGGQNWGYDNQTPYMSIIDLSDYVGQKIMFAFRYQGKDADYNQNRFYINEFHVLENNEVDVSLFAYSQYSDIPAQHVDWQNGLEFMAYIINQGQSIPDGATYTLEIPEIGYFETVALTEAMFAANDTIVDVVTFIPDSGEYKTYNFNIQLDVDNNLTAGMQGHSVTTRVDDEDYEKKYDNDTEEMTFEAYDGIGTVYELKQPDYLNRIYAWFGPSNTGEQFSVSIIKLASPDATNGELIATVDDSFGSNFFANSGGYNVYPDNDNNIGEYLYLEPGYYAFMFNQMYDDSPIYIYRSDDVYDKTEFARGNFDMLYNEPDDRGMLYMYVEFRNNNAPYFTLNSMDDEVIYQGETFERTISVKDDNPYGTIYIETISLPSWMSFTDNGDGTGTLTGNSTTAMVGTHNVAMRVHDRFNTTQDGFVITIDENPAPVFGTTPPSKASEGIAFTYVASAYDINDEDVTISGSQIPGWITATVSAAGDEITLTGTPTSANLGNNVVKLTATDEFGQTTHQTFDLFVYSNSVPMFTSSPYTMAYAGTEYMYYVVAMDANEDETLTLSEGTNFPGWLTLTPGVNGKGIISGTPAAGDAGENQVDVVVTDDAGASATQSFTIMVTANTAPQFTSTAATTATEDLLYEYLIAATDDDNDYLYFEVVRMPTWLVLTVTGNGTATLRGVPTQKYVGDNEVILNVGDGNETDQQQFTITVAEVNDAPQFKSAAETTTNVGVEYEYIAEAIDEEGMSLIYNSFYLPEWMTIQDQFDGTAIIKGTPAEPGDYEVSLKVSDGVNTTTQTFKLSVAGAVNVDQDENSALNIYPNPTTGIFTIENIEGADVFIYNATGKVVKQINNASLNEMVNLSTFNNGSYIVRIITENNVTTKQINLIK